MTTGYQLTELVDSGPKSATVAADGTAQVVWGPVNGGEVWRVFRIVVLSNSALAGPAKLYLDDADTETNLRGGTGSGQGDVDSGDILLVPATRSLVVAWSSLTPGATCSAILQYQRLTVVTFAGDSLPGTLISSGTG